MVMKQQQKGCYRSELCVAGSVWYPQCVGTEVCVLLSRLVVRFDTSSEVGGIVRTRPGQGCAYISLLRHGTCRMLVALVACPSQTLVGGSQWIHGQ